MGTRPAMLLGLQGWQLLNMVLCPARSAVSAVLLYLALRPGKGWLRRAVPVQSETAGESPASSSSTKPTAPTSVGWLWSRTVASDSRPPVSPMQPTGTATPILPNSLPLSYISSSDSCGTARR